MRHPAVSRESSGREDQTRRANQTRKTAWRSTSLNLVPDTSTTLLRAHTRSIPKLPQRKRLCESAPSSSCRENRSVALEPAATLHVASTHAGEGAPLNEGFTKNMLAPTSSACYPSLAPLPLALWGVETLLCVHVPRRISPSSKSQWARTKSRQAVVRSARASDAMNPAYSMARWRMGDVAND